MQSIFSAGIILGSLVAFSGLASAQMSIRETQNAHGTTVSGEVVRIFGEDFILDDGTGQILIEAESRPLRQANLSVGETVTVLGELDENAIDAYRITRSNGEEIYIFDD